MVQPILFFNLNFLWLSLVFSLWVLWDFNYKWRFPFFDISMILIAFIKYMLCYRDKGRKPKNIFSIITVLLIPVFGGFFYLSSSSPTEISQVPFHLTQFLYCLTVVSGKGLSTKGYPSLQLSVTSLWLWPKLWMTAVIDIPVSFFLNLINFLGLLIKYARVGIFF